MSPDLTSEVYFNKGDTKV